MEWALMYLVCIACTIGALICQFSAKVPASTTLRSVSYLTGDEDVAREIASRWSQLNASGEPCFQSIEGNAPAWVRASYYILPDNSGTKLTFMITCGRMFPQRKGELHCLFRNHAKKNDGVDVVFSWIGSDAVTSDVNSDEYKIVNYFIDLVEQESIASGCRLPAPKGLSQKKRRKQKRAARAAASSGPTTSGKIADSEWWREYADQSERALGDFDYSSNEGTNADQQYSFWPNPHDYLESVQNPSICLNDPELKQASAKTNHLGLPKVASGAFASVYEFSNGVDDWAVRCFTTKPDDIHARYKAISNFVLTDNLSYTVDFNYQVHGIRVNGEWFPILKMDWADGLPLDAYVREHLHDAEKLKGLRREFRDMVGQLRNNGIAHGDLQHGNILVDDGELYLVDYDCMYVPELAGFQSNELGHRNYQHPKRTAQHFGPYLDNFSAWLIDLSLLCLIEDPSLWQQFSGGDECLLFKSSDLASPEKSQLFAALSSHKMPEIRSAAQQMIELLKIPVENLPALLPEAESIKFDELLQPNSVQQ